MSGKDLLVRNQWKRLIANNKQYVKNEEFSLESSTVTLTYKYSQAAAINDYFFWYQQHPGKSPEFLLYHYGTQRETKGRLSAAVSDDKNYITMKISSAALTDSAVYYCALQPTLNITASNCIGGLFVNQHLLIRKYLYFQ
uniref:Immunoglobulin V-set domain-containing protein n=1 Tax=Acanthochromis polyacanthus TaxID=80966 RepID=A0A3Q1GR45_9TELE